VLEEEVAFHKTVNLLQTFYLQEVEEQHRLGE